MLSLPLTTLSEQVLQAAKRPRPVFLLRNKCVAVFKRCNWGFGISDSESSSPPITVGVYLDGKPIASKIVSPSQAESLSLDVSSVSNVSIETVCSSHSQFCDQLYFFNASLEPRIPSPNRKN